MRRDRDDEHEDFWQDHNWDITRPSGKRPIGDLAVNAWRHGAIPVAAATAVAWWTVTWDGAALATITVLFICAATTVLAIWWAWRQWQHTLNGMSPGIPQSFEAYESGVAVDSTRRWNQPDQGLQRRLRNTILVLAAACISVASIGSIAGATVDTTPTRGNVPVEIETALFQLDSDVRATAVNATGLRQAWMTRGSLGITQGTEVIGVLRDTAWITLHTPEGPRGTWCLKFTVPTEPSILTPCGATVNQSRTVPAPSRNITTP